MNKFNDEVVKYLSFREAPREARYLEGESYKRALKFSQKNNFEVVVSPKELRRRSDVKSYNGSPLQERGESSKKRAIFVELEGRDPYDIEDSKVVGVHL
jgi:hypothetical protein